METPSQSDYKAIKVDPLFVPDRNLELFDEDKLFQHFKVSNEVRYVSCTKIKFGGERKKIKGKTFFKVWFKDTAFENVHFQDCIFDGCWLLGAVFQNCEFHDCQFKNCNTHKVRFDRTHIDPRSFSKLPDKSQYSNIGVHLFQELFRNSHEMLQPDFKNSAEYEFGDGNGTNWLRAGVVPVVERGGRHADGPETCFSSWFQDMVSSRLA